MMKKEKKPTTRHLIAKDYLSYMNTLNPNLFYYSIGGIGAGEGGIYDFDKDELGKEEAEKENNPGKEKTYADDKAAVEAAEAVTQASGNSKKESSLLEELLQLRLHKKGIGYMILVAGFMCGTYTIMYLLRRSKKR